MGLLNRRRFLKYAGASAAVVGASALGLNYVSQQSPSMMSPTTSTTLVPRRTTTSVSLSSSTESVQLASLQGRLFFDYNGNGVQDAGEPAVQGASVQLKDSTGTIIAEALTDSSGDYTLEGVRTGSYRLHVEGDEKFHYMCRSTDEFTAVSEGYDVLLDRSQTVDIGLMEGFLTSPFHRGISQPSLYVDLDPGSGIRDWKGGRETYNGHGGTDFLAKKDTPILAAAPGTIVAAYNDFPNNPGWTKERINHYWVNGNFVMIDHGSNIYTAYHHLDSIAVKELLSWNYSGTGPPVMRGELVGYCGNKTMVPPDFKQVAVGVPFHLHFQILDWNRKDPERDPFRDLYYERHGISPRASDVSLWTDDNRLHYA